jgi:hypothetical protein
MKNYLPLARGKKSVPKALIGDPLSPGKSLDSRSEALRE